MRGGANAVIKLGDIKVDISKELQRVKELLGEASYHAEQLEKCLAELRTVSNNDDPSTQP